MMSGMRKPSPISISSPRETTTSPSRASVCTQRRPAQIGVQQHARGIDHRPQRGLLPAFEDPQGRLLQSLERHQLGPRVALDGGTRRLQRLTHGLGHQRTRKLAAAFGERGPPEQLVHRRKLTEQGFRRAHAAAISAQAPRGSNGPDFPAPGHAPTMNTAQEDAWNAWSERCSAWPTKPAWWILPAGWRPWASS